MPTLDLGPAALLLGAAAGDARDLPAHRVPRRDGRVGQRRRRRLARLREHALPRARALLRRSAVVGPAGLGSGARAALRHRRADARRRHRRGRRPRRPAPARVRARDRRRPELRQDARRRVLRHARRDRRGSVLRRGGPGAHGLHRLRSLHGRLPVQREEHAAQELPVARRARGRDDHARPPGRRHPAAGSRGRLGRLRGHHRGDRPLAAPRPARAHGARRGRRGGRRWARTGCSPARGSPARCRGSPPGWASSCGRTRRRSSPSRCHATRPT